jgi:hypothetical protein
MSINYIKKNIDKFDKDNLISFLFDIITCGGLDTVEDFDPKKQYNENEKVYYKDAKGLHHIYKCIVEKSTIGDINQMEWIDLLQSFRKPLVDSELITSSVDIGEEVIISTEQNQVEFRLTTPGVDGGLYDIIVFHPDLGRLARSDFELSGQYIILDDQYKVQNVGSKLIVDLYRMV